MTSQPKISYVDKLKEHALRLVYEHSPSELVEIMEELRVKLEEMAARAAEAEALSPPAVLVSALRRPAGTLQTIVLTVGGARVTAVIHPIGRQSPVDELEAWTEIRNWALRKIQGAV